MFMRNAFFAWPYMTVEDTLSVLSAMLMARTQISDLISAFIIYLCGFVLFFRLWFNRWLDKRDEKAKKGGKA